MDLSSQSIWYSKLGSEVILAELLGKLSTFSENEKTKVVLSWLCNCYSDLTNADFDTNPSKNKNEAELLNNFVVHIRLLNTLVVKSSPEIAKELADFFATGFLKVFIEPSILGSAADAYAGIAQATFYFQVTCQNVSEQQLVKKIVKFTMVSLLPTLIHRVNSENSEILQATLGLLKALLELYCEDLWHELILQYLLPMKHVLVSERQKSVPEINVEKSTTKFLDLIPDSILNIVGPENMSLNFILHVQDQLGRLKDMESAISNKCSIPTTSHLETDLETSFDASYDDNSIERASSENKNKFFPNWAFKYDGTDVLFASRKFSILQEPEEFFEDDLFQFIKQSEHDNSQSSSCGSGGAPTITVYSKSMSYLQHVQNSLSVDPNYFSSSPEENQINLQSNKKVGDDQGYLGPFLEALYKILSNWPRLEPDLLLVASDIISILASSRIPLITSILLDLSIVLQPSFPSFHGVIHGIKARLDSSLKKHPEVFLKDVWKNLAKNSKLFPNDFDDVEDNNSGGDSSFKEKILASTPFSYLNQISKGKSSTLFSKVFGQNPSLVHENRILNQSTFGNFETEEERIRARKVALRGILFAHWMLELAAIAHQQCWTQTQRNHREEHA